jgi:hypothetical protein
MFIRIPIILRLKNLYLSRLHHIAKPLYILSQIKFSWLGIHDAESIAYRQRLSR